MKKALYILGQLTDPDVDWLFKAGSKLTLPPGQVLIREGQPIEAVYIVLVGTLAIIAGGKEINQVGTGDVVGEMSFVDARPPSATVKAVDTATLLAIPRAALQKKLEQDPGFGSRFYKALSIFLSYKMRGVMGLLGYGEPGKVRPADSEEDDDLDDNVMETVYLAGLRFERLIKQILTEKDHAK